MLEKQLFLQQCTRLSHYDSNPYVCVIPELMLPYVQKS